MVDNGTTPAEALEQVRALHTEALGTTHDAEGRLVQWPHCVADREDWPCPTVAILDAVTPDAPVTVETDAHHRVTITFEGGYPSYRFTCTAPADALCRADWSCECEQYYDTQVRNGVPAHQPCWDGPVEWHAGAFKADFCGLKDWFGGPDDTPLEGDVTVPVEAEWEGDSYTFTVLTPATPERTEQEREAPVERVRELKARANSDPENLIANRNYVTEALRYVDHVLAAYEGRGEQ